jgi:hypothetical protein
MQRKLEHCTDSFCTACSIVPLVQCSTNGASKLGIPLGVRYPSQCTPLFTRRCCKSVLISFTTVHGLIEGVPFFNNEPVNLIFKLKFYLKKWTLYNDHRNHYMLKTSIHNCYPLPTSPPLHYISIQPYTFNPNPRWLSHPSCSPRHSNRSRHHHSRRRPWVWATIFDKSRCQHLRVKVQAAYPGRERWITPVPALRVRSNGLPGQELDSHPVPAFASPRSKAYRVKNAGLHPPSASATPGQDQKPPGGQERWIHTPCQHLRLRSR